MYKEDLALNNLQWLIYHKTLPNQIIYIQYICIKSIWHWITYKGWYTIKPNQTESYIIYMYKEDLVLNNLQEVICHKTKPNQTKLDAVSYYTQEILIFFAEGGRREILQSAYSKLCWMGETLVVCVWLKFGKYLLIKTLQFFVYK